jgi:integrase
VSGAELTDNLHLTKLISSFYLERPRDRKPFPSWDLSLVLARLLRAPFEPLQSAEPKYLSWKVAFLLALATAKRRSELRAFSKSILRTENWSSVTLKPLVNFVAKTEVPGRPETRLQDVTIPALGPYLGPDLDTDAKNCPVRAIKIYLSRTQAKRENRQEFFIPYKPGCKTSISPPTISSWIKKTVLFAYQDASPDEAANLQVRAHDLRAMATSWNLHSSVRLTDILKAAQWRSHNTFTSFYLKDMTLYEEDILRLGPLVTAQNVTNI